MPQPIAMAIPFAVDASGKIAQNSSAVGQLNDRVTALASTIPGTRVMATNFGIDTQSLLFAPSDALSVSEITNDLRVKLAVYDPTAELTSVVPVTNAYRTGITGITCTATRKDSVTTGSVTTTKVTIGVGGVVTDYVSTTTG